MLCGSCGACVRKVGMAVGCWLMHRHRPGTVHSGTARGESGDPDPINVSGFVFSSGSVPGSGLSEV